MAPSIPLHNIPLSSLLTTLTLSPHAHCRMLGKPTGYVSLGKLQVLVIMSCFELTVDGKVDYVKYAPLTVNIIRMLNNPAALRQKAEIIESQGATPSHPLPPPVYPLLSPTPY